MSTLEPRQVLTEPAVQMVSNSTGEPLSVFQSLSTPFDLTQLLVHREVLKPGHRASAPHFHSHKEEIFLVLEGQPSVRVGDKLLPVNPGEFIGFKPQPIAHMLVNHSDRDAIVLTIGTNSSEDQITFVSELP